MTKELEDKLKLKNGRITLLEDSVTDLQDEIMMLKAQLELKNNKPGKIETMKESISIDPKQDPKINELKKVIVKQNHVIGRFKGSIVYPFYRITSWIGKTIFGKR